MARNWTENDKTTIKFMKIKLFPKKRSNTKGIWTENVWIDDKAEKHEMNKIFEISRHCFPWPWIVECAQSIIGFRWLIGGQEELIKIHAWLANPSVTAGPVCPDTKLVCYFFFPTSYFWDYIELPCQTSKTGGRQVSVINGHPDLSLL